MGASRDRSRPGRRHRRRRGRRAELQAPAVRRHQHDRPAHPAPGAHAQDRDAGPGLPAGLPAIGWRQLGGLLRRPRGRPFRIWHARRNVEMIGGVLLRDVLRAPLKLVFTSAAQRNHQPLTKWLIRRMDAVIATNPRSASFLEVPHTVIMHGVDLEKFHPAQDPEDAFAAAGLPGKHAIGCFGRVRHQKGTDLFVDAMIALLPEFPEWTAVITGRVTVEHQAFARDLERRVAEAGLGEPHRLPRRGAGHKALVPAPLALCGAVAQRRLWADAAGGDGVRLGGRGQRCRRLCRPDRRGEDRLCRPGGRWRGADRGDPPILSDPALLEAHRANALADVRQRFPLEGEAAAIGKVYEGLGRVST